MQNINVNEKKKIGIVVVILVILLLVVVIVRTQRDQFLSSQFENKSGQNKTAGNVTPTSQVNGVMSLSLPTDDIKTGETVPVTVTFSAPGKIVAGADAVLIYDPVYFTSDDNVNFTNGSHFESYPREQIDAERGIIKVTAYKGQNTILSGDVNFFSVNLIAAKAGKTEIKIDFIKGTTNKSTLVEKGTAKNILNQVNGAQIVIR